MKNLRFTIFIFVFLLISCASVENVRTVEMKPFNEVVKYGEIITKSNGNYDNYSKDDILISNISTTTSDSWKGYFASLFPNNKTTANINFSESLYKLTTKYVTNGDFLDNRPYKITITIKKFDKTFKPHKIELSGMNSGLELYYNYAYPDDMPVEITFFYLQGKRFSLVATMYSGTGEDLMKYPEQRYFIVDEEGNVYAGFTIHDYFIYNQPDMDKYNLIPVIASYVIVRNIVVSYSKSSEGYSGEYIGIYI